MSGLLLKVTPRITCVRPIGRQGIAALQTKELPRLTNQGISALQTDDKFRFQRIAGIDRT
jgi:hypothetical protein